MSIMAANNEIGTVQARRRVRQRSAGSGGSSSTPTRFNGWARSPSRASASSTRTLLSICAHKIHGPKGAGALFVRSPLLPDPVLFGGGHANERRAGTENLAGVIGLVEALERFVREPVFPKDLLLSFDRPSAEPPGSSWKACGPVGSRHERLANTVSFVVEGADNIALLAGLDLEGICASSGSACSAGSLEPSHVIRALGLR